MLKSCKISICGDKMESYKSRYELSSYSSSGGSLRASFLVGKLLSFYQPSSTQSDELSHTKVQDVVTNSRALKLHPTA